MNQKSAKVGILFIVCSALAWFLAPSLIPQGLRTELYRLYGMVPTYGPLCALTIAGLALYISGRRKFWSKVEYRKISILLVIFGPILTVLGAWFSFWTYSISSYLASKPPDSPLVEELAQYSLALLLYILWTVSGIVLLYDGYKQALEL